MSAYPELERALARTVADGGGPGIVAELMDHGETWFGTVGVADMSTGRAREPGEHFRIGSFTKAFVGTVVLRLAADGRLSLDDTLVTWQPGVAEEHLGADGTKITIRQLLNHTSGLPDAILGEEPPPPAAPGERFIYSKLNYTFAGMIVEQAAGSSLAEEIDRLIARPLGLAGTYLPGTEAAAPREPYARHYSRSDETGNDAETHDVTDADLSWAWAAGGMVSTTSDLLRYLGALLRGDLLPPQWQEEMFGTVPTGTDWVPGTAYGLGVYAQRLPSGVTLWGGGGFIQGSMTYAMGDRDGDRLLVANLNGDWNDFLETCTTLYDPVFPQHKLGEGF